MFLMKTFNIDIFICDRSQSDSQGLLAPKQTLSEIYKGIYLFSRQKNQMLNIFSESNSFSPLLIQTKSPHKKTKRTLHSVAPMSVNKMRTNILLSFKLSIIVQV